MEYKVNNIRLVCSRCGEKLDFNPLLFRCPICGGPLNIEWEKTLSSFRLDKNADGVFKFRKFFPPNLPITSLGEGNTPIIKSWEKNLYFKLEYLNPSGSFKDRGSALAISLVKKYNLKEVNEDSSGNAGASIAFYSTAFGIRANIYMPKDAPENKKNLVKIIGGRLKLEENREKANIAAVKDSIENKVYYVGHVFNPFFIVGLKSISYETYLENIFPEDIFIPVGSGSLYLGIYHGYKDLLDMGLIDTMPRLHSVEVPGYERIAKKIYGKEMYPDEKTELADGLRVPGPPRINEILKTLRDTKGRSLVVSEEEIKEATKILIKKGLFIEPTSATAYAAYRKTILNKLIDKENKVLIPLTGSGFKALDKIKKLLKV